MAQIVFLDTNVILDYLENRNQEVRDIVAQLLLLHKKNKIALATSVYNLAETLDSEFQIHFIAACVNERMSCDEIVSKLRRDRKLYKQVAERNKKGITKKIDDFIFEKGIVALSISFDSSSQSDVLYKLIYDQQLRSQDALIVATAHLNDATYFLSNDSDLIVSIGELMNCYNLRDKGQRDSFRNDVLEAI